MNSIKTPLKIVFISDNSIRSNIIQTFTNSKWSHIGVITKEENNKVKIHEALDEGLIHNTYYRDKINLAIKDGTWEIKTIYVDMPKEQILKRANVYIGKKYDWRAIVLIVLFKYIGIIDDIVNYFFTPKIKVRNLIYLFNSPKKLICSEFIARLIYDASYKTINFAEEYNKPYDLITPANIYNSNIFIKQGVEINKNE